MREGVRPTERAHGHVVGGPGPDPRQFRQLADDSLRVGRRLKDDRYRKAGLKVCDTLFAEPYLSTDPAHQGLILHSVYHRPNGWDAIPAGAKVPAGESSMWGDYHAREAALYLLRLCSGPYLTFFGAERAGVAA